MPKVTLTDKQMELISFSCDIISRLLMGQVDEINRLYNMKVPRHFLKEVKKYAFPELSDYSYYGIASDKIDNRSAILYDVHQVMRHYLAWKDEDNTPETRDWVRQLSLVYDEPDKLSDEPLPVIDNKKVYVVLMQRYGDPESHSYIAGAFSSIEKAEKAGDDECNYRGGKYEYVIREEIIDGKE